MKSISGPGIAPGHDILPGFPFGPGFPYVTLSNPTTSDQSERPSERRARLRRLPRRDPGSAGGDPRASSSKTSSPATSSSAAGESKKPPASIQVFFAGDLAGTEPPLTATSSLTGAGAGVAIARAARRRRASLSVASFGGIAPGHARSSPTPPADCPDASKLGTVRIDTPLIDHPLEGDVYLASPEREPVRLPARPLHRGRRPGRDRRQARRRSSKPTRRPAS